MKSISGSLRFKSMIVVCLASSMLAGCGIKAPLYMPQKPGAPAPSTPMTVPDSQPAPSDVRY